VRRGEVKFKNRTLARTARVRHPKELPPRRPKELPPAISGLDLFYVEGWTAGTVRRDSIREAEPGAIGGIREKISVDGGANVIFSAAGGADYGIAALKGSLEEGADGFGFEGESFSGEQLDGERGG